MCIIVVAFDRKDKLGEILLKTFSKIFRGANMNIGIVLFLNMTKVFTYQCNENIKLFS